jgi:hypothetical protein
MESSPYVQQDLLYDNFGFHCLLRTEFINFPMMM